MPTHTHVVRLDTHPPQVHGPMPEDEIEDFCSGLGPGTFIVAGSPLGDAPTQLDPHTDRMVPLFDMLGSVRLQYNVGRSFLHQNNILREGFFEYLNEVATVDHPRASVLRDRFVYAVDDYAEVHSGGLVVLHGLTKGGLHVKLHDSWGDDETIVVHIYDADGDGLGDGEFDQDNGEVVQQYRPENAHLALRLFLGLVSD